MSFITNNFADFKKKIEPIFGSIDELLKTNPDMYAHHVISHGFMEYLFYDKKVIEDIKNRILAEFNDKIDKEKKIKLYEDKYWICLKEVYLNWAKENKIPENLVEQGWQEYIND